MVALGLHCCALAFSSCSQQGYSLLAVNRLTAVASLAAEPRLQGVGAVVVVHRLSCSLAYGIFPDQGSKLCPLYWQADSYPLEHQGSPREEFDLLECARDKGY